MSETVKPPRNHSKNRTHIPVEGFTIEALRTKKLEDLLEIATSLNIEDPNEPYCDEFDAQEVDEAEMALVRLIYVQVLIRKS